MIFLLDNAFKVRYISRGIDGGVAQLVRAAES